MKKYLISIFMILFILPAMADMVVSGTVVDEKGDPLPGATVVPEGTDLVTTSGAVTDSNGNFSIKNFPEDKKIQISFTGYKTQIVSPKKNIKVSLKEEALDIDEVVVHGCAPKDNYKSAIYDTALKKCFPTQCASERYELTNVRTVKRSSTGTPYICTGSTASGGPCAKFCTSANEQCESVQIGDKCEDKVGKKCTATDANAKKAEYKWENNQLICEIKSCNSGYLPNSTGTACEVSSGPCPAEQIKEIEHATAGELKNGKCLATECETGYEVSDGKCANISGECKPMPDNAISAHREWDSNSGTEICIIDSCKDGYSVSNDKKSCISPTLSKEDSEAKIAELQKNADAMKEKEQSTANKLLGAASIGAMGIGGMQAASALAEQSADATAEQDMAAYLATFKCDYGQGTIIQGGESNITLPGANILLPIYNEYTTLAADLKIRKEALEMTPGIESEVILDAATSGLYDNAATGKTDGAFTSLSKALMDENSEDAAEWAAQKSDTSSQLKTGAIVAGAGALVGVVGNVLINETGDKVKESSAEIIAKYEPLKKLRDNTKKLPDNESNVTCPSDATGTYPNCMCTNNKYIHNANTNLCEACPGDQIAINNACQCDAGTVPGTNNTCITPQPNVTAKCDTSAGHVTVDQNTGNCTCTDGYILNTDSNPKCTCPTETHELNSQGQCVTKTKQTTNILSNVLDTVIEPITLSTGNLFKLNSSELTPEATQTLKTFVTDVKSAINNDTNYCINITGHTDKSGSDSINIPLSEKRANAVKNALVSGGLQSSNITAKGVGSSQCTSTSTYDKDCRKVEISFSNNKC